MTAEEREQFLADRVREGLEIDPETAEVEWVYVRAMDPYGIDPDLPEELHQTVRGYFARSPGGAWVCFYDLPDATRNALWQKHKGKLALSEQFKTQLSLEAEQFAESLFAGQLAAMADGEGTAMVKAADEAAEQAAPEERLAKYRNLEAEQRAKAARLAVALKDVPPQVLEDMYDLCVDPFGDPAYLREALGLPPNRRHGNGGSY
jgi:hypothetical protein